MRGGPQSSPPRVAQTRLLPTRTWGSVAMKRFAQSYNNAPITASVAPPHIGTYFARSDTLTRTTVPPAPPASRIVVPQSTRQRHPSLYLLLQFPPRLPINSFPASFITDDSLTSSPDTPA
ncbi:hypothetical protein GY45DRAFT_449271 [Cubamyces sp. BRFM 1775]|nr:hypothetical protein GY45DRAFT_449271 [Cubamyces sp. BRFM 1775]